ncbi:MAG: YceI family protein [Acidimicrobiales bacterium]
MEVFELFSVAAMLGVVALAVRLVRTNAAIAADLRARVRRPTTWLVGVPTLMLVVLVGIPYVELHVLNGATPKPLSFADLGPGPTTTLAGPTPPGSATPTTGAPAVAASGRPRPTGRAQTGSGVAAAAVVAPDPVAGSWSVGTGTEARYGINDNAMGQTTRVVGRTHDVSGAVQIVGYTVTSAKVIVNMQTVTCQCVHDAKYRQMLETSKYPTSMFVLTAPVSLPSIPAPGAVIAVPITGDFTIHGVTRATTFSLKATRIGPRIAVMATIPVNLSDYNISAPNSSMGGLSDCTIDFLVAFDRTG